MSMTKIFGILNITPDSFSDGGRYLDPLEALKQAQKLIQAGADYIDVGAQSTRPGAKMIDWKEEWERLEPILEKLIQAYPGKISLDTFRAEIAEKFIELGGTILNDVTGFQDPKMREVAKKLFLQPLNISSSCPASPVVIINHFPGRTVEEVHEQKMSSIKKVKEDLLERKQKLIQEGIPAQAIILDPGIGFGKTVELNRKLLEFAKELPEEKILIGHSRKRFLGENRFDPSVNLAAGKKALEAGAAFLRVHELDGYNLKATSQVAVFGGLGSQTDYAVDAFKCLKGGSKKYYFSMQAVCEAVLSQEVECGILPIYNTVGGDVPESLEALQNPSLKEVERQTVDISFHLAAKEPLTLKQVKKVVSHWQSLEQSKAWLRNNMAHVKKEKVTSSALAAQCVKTDPDKFIACICHHKTVLEAGLVFLANHIEEPGNKTTFVCLTKINQ